MRIVRKYARLLYREECGTRVTDSNELVLAAFVFSKSRRCYSDLSNVRYLTKLSFSTSRVSVAWKIKIKAGIETFAAHKEPVNKLPCARPRKSARQGDEFQSN